MALNPARSNGTPARLPGWLVLLGACLLLAPPAGAQSLGLDPDHDLPVWMRSWSALGIRADLPRRLPGAGTATSSLFYGAPRIGGFWTAGNPAGLVEGVQDARTDFAGAFTRQTGDYKRPLDPGTARLLQASAQSWRRFSKTFSMLGRVTLDQERLAPSARGDFTEDFDSSPFVTTDTSTSPVRRTRAVLEGAAGWRLGGWGLGTTIGYEARDNITGVSGVIRRGKIAAPALVLGMSRQLGRVNLGVYGRLKHAAETVNIVGVAVDPIVYELAGYREAPLLDVGLGGYYRRREQDVGSVGSDLSGRLGSAHWTLYAERNRLAERLWRQQVNDPAKDSWDSRGWTAGGALQRPLGSRWLFTWHARGSSLSGNGNLALDSAGVIFHADEQQFETEAELRLLPLEYGWTGTLTLGLVHESRTRTDSTARLATDVSSTTPTIAVEVGRRLGSALHLSVGGAVAFYAPTSALPNPANRGPVYQYYFASEYALYAARAHPISVSFLIRYRAGKGTELWISGRAERLSAADAAASTGFLPPGSRTAGGLVGGVTVLAR